MYHPLNQCSMLIHILAKHPILVVALGLVGAVHFLTGPMGLMQPSSVIPIEQQVQILETDAGLREQTAEASATFEGVITEESSVHIKSSQIAEIGYVTRYFEAILDAKHARRVRGVHPDGKSYGPSGLTRLALRELLRKLPDCTALGVTEALLTPEENLKLGYIYFLDLVHEFKNVKNPVETSVVAYHIGPTKVKKLMRQKKALPHLYLDAVKKFLKE